MGGEKLLFHSVFAIFLFYQFLLLLYCKLLTTKKIQQWFYNMHFSFCQNLASIVGVKATLLEIGFIEAMRTTQDNKEVSQTLHFSHNSSYFFLFVVWLRAMGNRAFHNFVTSQNAWFCKNSRRQRIAMFGKKGNSLGFCFRQRFQFK